MSSIDARERVIRSVLRLVASERDDAHAAYDAELEYANDMLDEAVLDLAAELHEEGKW